MKNKIVFLLLILLLLNGCSFGKDKQGSDNWENEVLVASECGMDGLRCCSDPEVACQFGQECCVDPNNPENNYCADNCNFGQMNTFCRQGDPQCDEGLACFGSKCIVCGNEKQPCCSGNCQEGLLCHQDQCLKCGEAGAPCCAVAPGCTHANSADETRTECINGVCTFCGTNGGAACPDAPRCNPGHLLNNEFCLNCGGYNQPCCDTGAGAGSDCDQAEGLSCILGFCSRAK